MSEKIIITISREYGSGGRLVGKKLAQLLNIPFYDNELITLAAEKTGLSKDYFKDAESSSVGNMLLSLSNLLPNNSPHEIYGLPLNEKIFLVQSQVIRDVAEKGSCVIIGRCADYVLKDNPYCTNVFIHADMKDKIRRTVDVYELTEKNVEYTIVKTDKRRANYYSYFTNQKWGQAENYELILNSSKIGIDNAAEVIKTYVLLKQNNIS